MARRPSVGEVLAGLEAEGLLDTGTQGRARSALEAHQRTDVATPWFVKALAGFGAWVAAAFLLSFFACVGLWKEDVAMMVLGLVLCGGATALRRTARGVFLEQLALALCIAGSMMVSVGLAQALDSELAPAFVQLVLGPVLLVYFPDAIFRFLTSASMAASAVFLLTEAFDVVGLQLGLLACAVLVHWLFLEGARLRRGRWGDLVGPAAYALACGVMGVLLTIGVLRRLGGTPTGGFKVPDGGLLTLGLTAVTLYTAWRVMKELELEPAGVAGAAVFVALGATALLTLHTPALICAVGMLVLGFHRRGADLVGLAAAFLLAAGSWYYYDLGLTLLAKALALTGSGLVFLGLRLFLLRRFPAAAAEVR